jgi:hypothetical protein
MSDKCGYKATNKDTWKNIDKASGGYGDTKGTSNKMYHKIESGIPNASIKRGVRSKKVKEYH